MPNFDRTAGKRSFRLAAALLLLASSASSASAQSGAPKLIPVPRELHADALLPFTSATIVFNAPASPQTTIPGAEDLFTAQDLTQALATEGVQIGSCTGAHCLSIALFASDSLQAKRLLAENNLTITPAMHDEGYVLITHAPAPDDPREPVTAALIADTPTGRFYAAQTLKQLVERGGTGAALWTATIRDWP